MKAPGNELTWDVVFDGTVWKYRVVPPWIKTYRQAVFQMLISLSVVMLLSACAPNAPVATPKKPQMRSPSYHHNDS